MDRIKTGWPKKVQAKQQQHVVSKLVEYPSTDEEEIETHDDSDVSLSLESYPSCSSDTYQDPWPKRKRGRPKKVDKLVEAPKPQRKRGRPRKVQAEPKQQPVVMAYNSVVYPSTDEEEQKTLQLQTDQTQKQNDEYYEGTLLLESNEIKIESRFDEDVPLSAWGGISTCISVPKITPDWTNHSQKQGIVNKPPSVAQLGLEKNRQEIQIPLSSREMVSICSSFAQELEQDQNQYNPNTGPSAVTPPIQIKVEPYQQEFDSVMSPKAVQNNYSLVGGSATTFHKETLLKNTLVGRNSVVGNNSVIKDSIIMANVTIEDGTSIEQCIIHDGVEVKKGSVLKSCIIGPSYVVAEGSSHENQHLKLNP